MLTIDEPIAPYVMGGPQTRRWVSRGVTLWRAPLSSLLCTWDVRSDMAKSFGRVLAERPLLVVGGTLMQ